MKILYTNAQEPLGDQRDPLISLGGYVSSTPVPNDLAGNLFSDISEIASQEISRETKAIALLNNTGSEISSLSAWIEFDDISYVDVEIAFAAINQNGGAPFMERIANLKASPFSADFQEASENDKLILMDPIQDGEYVGLWIRRTVKIPSPIDVYPGTIANLKPGEAIEVNGAEKTKEQLQREIFKIRLSWT